MSALYAALQHRFQTAELLLMILWRADNLSDQEGKQAALELAIRNEDIDLVNHLIKSIPTPRAEAYLEMRYRRQSDLKTSKLLEFGRFRSRYQSMVIWMAGYVGFGGSPKK